MPLPILMPDHKAGHRVSLGMVPPAPLPTHLFCILAPLWTELTTLNKVNNSLADRGKVSQ